MNYEKMASDVIANVGGKDNIASAAHCVTRLRLVLKDTSKYDKEVLENKTIEVVFAKKPQENPNTKAFIGLIILISWLILFTNAILLKKSQELE